MENMKGMENMPGMGSTNMGPLMVMNGNDMGIRVGSSDTNIMSMGQMGSGTAWQPSSGPMLMYHKVAGDWLLIPLQHRGWSKSTGRPTRSDEG